MGELRKPLHTMQVSMTCADPEVESSRHVLNLIKRCNGTMLPTGEILTSSLSWYVHQCTDSYRKSYPFLEYREN